MNKFFLEPTDENLERHKRGEDTNTYWLTADFFQFDHSFEDEFSLIFDAYMNAIRESQEEDEDEAVHKIEFSIGKMLVKAARKAGISPQNYRDQYSPVIGIDLPSIFELDNGTDEKPTIAIIAQDPLRQVENWVEKIEVGTPFGLEKFASRNNLWTKIYMQMIDVLLELNARVYL